jgi:hypothetical protein
MIQKWLYERLHVMYTNFGTNWAINRAGVSP